MKKLAVLVAAAAAALAMSGCSAIPGVGGPQSGPEACVALQDTMAEVGQDMSDLSQNAASDPKAAEKAMDSMVTKLTEARGKITNEKVGAAVDKTISSAKAMSAMFHEAGGDFTKLDPKKFQTTAEDLSRAMGEISTSCVS